MGKLFYTISRDFMVFIRDIRSFMLLLTTPLSITILIGSVFITATPTNIPIIVCTDNWEANAEFYGIMVNQLWESGLFAVEEHQGQFKNHCEEIINEGIKTSRVRGGIIVPEQLTGNILVYVDNTKPVGTFIQSYVNIFSQDLSKRAIQEVIVQAKANAGSVVLELDRLEEDMQSQLDLISDARLSLNRLSADLLDTENRIRSIESNIDLDGTVDRLSLLDADVDRLTTGLDGVSGNLVVLGSLVAQANIQDPAINTSIKNFISSSQSQINSIRSSVDALKGDVDSIRASLESSADFLRGLNLNSVAENIRSVRSSLTTISARLADAEKVMGSTVSQVRTTKTRVNSLISSIPPEFSEPLRARVVGVFGDKPLVNFIFPSVIIIILMWMGVFLSSISFIKQRNQGILKRISISPTSTGFIILEKLISNSIITIVALPLILAAGAAGLGIQMSAFDVLAIFAVGTLAALIFVMFGLIIASFSKTEGTAILASLKFVIPLLFFTGIFYPTEAFLPIIKAVSEQLPTTISIRLLEGFIFYTLPPGAIMALIAKMLVYIVSFGVISWVFLRRTIRS